MTIRRAAAGEEDSVLAFYGDLIERMRNREYRPSWTIGVYPAWEDIHAAIAASDLFVALEAGAIVGAFILNHVQAESYRDVRWAFPATPDRVGVIHLLAVHPAIQGRGAAKELLRRAAEESRSRGDVVIRLDTLTWNLPGRRLYEGFGFRYCGDYQQTYPTTGTIPFSMFELDLTAASTASSPIPGRNRERMGR